ncbi:hypothetical protein CC2G_015104 [Coprinopsis cinerea AmutBmut pab1-1]|nr:hypothetical protein CC2G_015104 [Coprinopsis cinerea AmutBmut pab1-1]
MTPVRRSSLQAFINLSLRLASLDEAAFVKFTLTSERDDDPFRHGIDLSDSELEKRDPGITLFRKYTLIIGSSFSIELMSDLYVFRQLAPRVFDRENINLSWDLRLPDRIVVEKEHKHLPLIPIGTWGLNTRLGVVLSGLVTPEGDNSKIPDDKYMEFITLTLLPALAELNLEFEDHPEHSEPSAEIPATQVLKGKSDHIRI